MRKSKSAPDALRVAVIGVGHQGCHHARILAANPRCQLVGVADVSEEAARQNAQACRTQAFSDYRELLDKVDAVSIAVPTVAHHQVATDFMRAGVHVLVEKPIASTVDQAREMIELAHEKDLTLQVGHIERFSAAIRKLREMLTAPRFVECLRQGPFNPRIQDVGVVLDLMIHDLDIVLEIVRSPVEHIEAVGIPVLTEKEDIANARIRFQNGCIANVTASRVTPTKMRKIRIFQDGAYISINYEKQSMEVYKLAPLPPSKRKSIAKAEIVREHMPLKLGDKLELQLDHFLDCVLRGERPLVDGEAAMQALDVAVRISEQVKQVSDGYFAAQKMAQAANPIKGLWD